LNSKSLCFFASQYLPFGFFITRTFLSVPFTIYQLKEQNIRFCIKNGVDLQHIQSHRNLLAIQSGEEFILMFSTSTKQLSSILNGKKTPRQREKKPNKGGLTGREPAASRKTARPNPDAGKFLLDHHRLRNQLQMQYIT